MCYIDKQHAERLPGHTMVITSERGIGRNKLVRWIGRSVGPSGKFYDKGWPKNLDEGASGIPKISNQLIIQNG